MKSYNGLFERMLETEAILLAIGDSSKGKRNRTFVKRVLDDPQPMVEKIQKALISGTWEPPCHVAQTLQEGLHRKARNIVKPWWDDEQIVHHMIVDQLKPILMPRMYAHAYGSIPRAQYPKDGKLPSNIAPSARGTHAVKDTMVKWVKGYRNKRFYVAELDITSFYASIDHDILKSLLARLIRDKRFLDLCYKVIDQYPGLPLGYYTSPWLSHLYLMGMDNYVVQELKPDHYCRYVDNLYLFSANKRKLHKMVEALRTWLTNERHLTIKDNWQVYRFEDAQGVTANGKTRRRGRAIDCLGFVIHRGHVGLRKGILKRIRRRAMTARKTHRLTRRAASAYLSYMGYIWHSNTYGYYKRYVRPLLTTQACRRRISALSRKQLNGV